jgi:hypothetical protein
MNLSFTFLSLFVVLLFPSLPFPMASLISTIELDSFEP